MKCAAFDLKAYLLGEQGPAERTQLETHLASCAACREELERLRWTEAALLTLREEEIPRRIAFVAEPAPGWRRWLWASGPRWGFASALVLALAITAHGLLSSPSAPPAPSAADAAALERRVSAEVERRLEPLIRQAMAEAEARHRRRLQEEVAAVRREMEFQRKADLLAVEENFNVLKKRMNVLQIHLAGNLEGGLR